MPLLTPHDLVNERENIRSYMEWVKDLGVMYDRFLSEDDEDVSITVGWGSSKKRQIGVHASEVSGCQRRCVYTLLDTEKKAGDSAIWKRKFRTGHVIHSVIQSDFQRMCDATNGHIVFESEVRISPKDGGVAHEYNIHSSMDGLFTFYDEPHKNPFLRVGLEIKSEAPRAWEELKAPRPYHKEQCTIYMGCLEIPIMWTLYYNKGTQQLTPCASPYVFTFDPKLWWKLTERITENMEHAKKGTLPNRTEGKPCEFCPYAWTCDPQYLKDMERRKAAKHFSRTPRLGT